MNRTLVIKRQFPSYHPKAGQNTYFLEGIVKALKINGIETPVKLEMFNSNFVEASLPKTTQIIHGKKCKLGDIIDIQINEDGVPFTMVSDLEIKAVYDLDITNEGLITLDGEQVGIMEFMDIATHEGLSSEDLEAWLKYPSEFSGQIISWTGTEIYNPKNDFK